MDFREIFHSSFELLNKNRFLIFPVLASYVFPLFIILGFIFFSGLGGLALHYADLTSQFDAELQQRIIEDPNMQSSAFWLDAMGFLSKRGPYEEDLALYLEENGFYDEIVPFISWKYLTGVSAALFLALCAWFYFRCMLYSSIAMLLSKKSSKTQLTYATPREFFGFAALRFFVWIILLAPLLLFIALLAFSGSIGNEILFILFLLFGILAWLVYLIYMCVRLLLSTPLFFMDKSGVFSSISRSFQLSNGKFLPLLGVFGILIGINFLSSSIGITPFTESLAGLIFAHNAFKALVLLIMVLLFLVIGSFIISFKSLLLFASHNELKTIIRKR